ncbi:hypothetical protein BRC64_05030 [Halobacteriales archaeon QH_10_67_22]|nr:MAG: hypothetical protein BRC64_05030 [Halobacteriales archaeon QH_10_67_22]
MAGHRGVVVTDRRPERVAARTDGFRCDGGDLGQRDGGVAPRGRLFVSEQVEQPVEDARLGQPVGLGPGQRGDGFGGRHHDGTLVVQCGHERRQVVDDGPGLAVSDPG